MAFQQFEIRQTFYVYAIRHYAETGERLWPVAIPKNIYISQEQKNSLRIQFAAVVRNENK